MRRGRRRASGATACSDPSMPELSCPRSVAFIEDRLAVAEVVITPRQLWVGGCAACPRQQVQSRRGPKSIHGGLDQGTARLGQALGRNEACVDVGIKQTLGLHRAGAHCHELGTAKVATRLDLSLAMRTVVICVRTTFSSAQLGGWRTVDLTLVPPVQLPGDAADTIENLVRV